MSSPPTAVSCPTARINAFLPTADHGVTKDGDEGRAEGKPEQGVRPDLGLVLGRQHGRFAVVLVLVLVLVVRLSRRRATRLCDTVVTTCLLLVSLVLSGEDGGKGGRGGGRLEKLKQKQNDG